MVAAWSRRRWLAAVTAVAAGAALADRTFRDLGSLGPARVAAVMLGVPLAYPLLLLAALVLLAGGAGPPPRSWLWLPCLPVGMAALLVLVTRLRLGSATRALVWLSGLGVPAQYTHLFAIMAVASVCWLVTDFRPLLGLALGLAMTQFDVVSESVVFNSSGTGLTLGLQIGPVALIGIAIPLAVDGALVWRLRRTCMSQPES
jgi:hypothetical protein